MTTIEEAYKLLKLFTGTDEDANAKYMAELIIALNTSDYQFFLERLETISFYIESLMYRLRNEVSSSSNSV